MSSSELDRLRKLPLASAVILLTWSLAGISFVMPTHMDFVGIPILITRPELLPVGLAVTSLYGAAKYHYYATMLASSPYRRRRDILDQLRPVAERSGKIAPTYWGPTSFQSSLSYSDQQTAKTHANTITSAFPKFARARVESDFLEAYTSLEDGTEHRSWSLFVTIPLRCRVAAFLEDLDYAAPVWFPLLAVTLYVLRAIGSRAAA
jgi:hypothetical protein